MRRARLGLLALALGACAPPAPAPRPTHPHRDPALQAQIEEAVRGFHGDAGVYVHHLGSGATAEIRADELFPTASMIKVPLLARLFQRVDAGELSLDTTLVFRDSLRYSDEDVLGEFRDSATIPLGQVAFLTAALSDNTAALWIQALDGGGGAVNDWLAAHGFDSTRVNSRSAGRVDAWKLYGWGQTTPREIARLLVEIRRGQLLSPASSERLYRLLGKSYWDDVALAEIPPTVQVASKQGMVDRSRSEVLLVNAPSGPYVLSVITRNQADTTWTPENEGEQLIRRVSGLVYRHFNPEK